MDPLTQIRERLNELGDPVALLEGIFAFAPVGFQIYDVSGRSILVNPAFRQMFGSEPPPEYNVLTDEIAERNGVLDLVRRAFKGETVHIPPIWYDPRELQQVKVEEGRRVAIDSTFFPLFDRSGKVSHVAIVFKDVSVEKAAQEALERAQGETQARVASRSADLATANSALGERIKQHEIDVEEILKIHDALERSESQLTEAQRLTGIGSWDWDLVSGSLSWSAELRRLFGVESGAETSYDDFARRVHPDDLDLARKRIEQARDETGTLDHEYRIVRPDGQVRNIASRGHVVRNEEGRPIRFLGTAQDITDRRRAEAAEAAVERADEASRRKDEFLAMLGHELRNPLAPILSAVQLLGIKGRAEVATEAAVIERQVRHLTRLVDDLLDVSRGLHGKVELRKERVVVAEVLSQALEDARPELGERNHHIVIELPIHRLEILADRVRLAQAVTNLLRNAARYTPPGGRIGLQAGLEGEEAIIRVSDNGVGMSPELQGRVFEPFVQGDRGLDRSEGGLGLGLTIARTMIDRHGGSLSAHSAGPGQGSTFTIRLRAEKATATADAPLVLAAGTPVGPRRRVLIVEDNQDAAEMLEQVARVSGHETRVAADGASALKVVDAGFQPEVAFVDIGLPVMDGFELAVRLRKICGTRLRMVAVSGYGQDDDRARSREAGFDEHLVKPVDVAEMQRAIARAGEPSAVS